MEFKITLDLTFKELEEFDKIIKARNIVIECGIDNPNILDTIHEHVYGQILERLTEMNNKIKKELKDEISI